MASGRALHPYRTGSGGHRELTARATQKGFRCDNPALYNAVMIDAAGLRVIRAIADEGSFTGAASSDPEPAISQMVRRLEQRMGTVLVERLGRQVRLTEAGRVLARHAVRVLRALDAAEEEVAAIAGLRAGRVRLMAFPSSSATLVPRALAMVSKRLPGRRGDLQRGRAARVAAALRAGECDIAVAFAYEVRPRPAARTTSTCSSAAQAPRRRGAPRRAARPPARRADAVRLTDFARRAVDRRMSAVPRSPALPRPRLPGSPPPSPSRPRTTSPCSVSSRRPGGRAGARPHPRTRRKRRCGDPAAQARLPAHDLRRHHPRPAPGSRPWGPPWTPWPRAPLRTRPRSPPPSALLDPGLRITGPTRPTWPSAGPHPAPHPPRPVATATAPWRPWTAMSPSRSVRSTREPSRSSRATVLGRRVARVVAPRRR